MNIAYINGEFLPLEKARISAMDRGFLFGDGVYEVVPVFNGKLFRCDQHLARLQRSLEAIQLNLDKPIESLSTIVDSLRERMGAKEQSIYLQITRGPSMERAHVIPDEYTPTIFAYSREIPALNIDDLRQGVTAITAEDIRWQECFIKSINLLPNVLLSTQAKQQGAKEAILLRDGYISECSHSNVFIVEGQDILTPKLDPSILGGITRELVLEIAKTKGMTIKEIRITEQRLRDADEIWITASTSHIAPVIAVDGQAVSQGQAGPLWEQMIHYYQAYKQSL